MKRLVLILAVIGVGWSAYAQGTIQFMNGVLTRVKISWTPGIAEDVPTSIPLNYGVFWGTSPDPGSLSLVFPLGTSSTTIPGQIAGGASATYAIPGTTGGQTVYMQVKTWDARYGEDWREAFWNTMLVAYTDVRQVTLAPTAGPGTPIWQSATATNPNRFHPLLIIVPEPSCASLAALAAAAWLRRKAAAERN